MCEKSLSGPYHCIQLCYDKMNVGLEPKLNLFLTASEHILVFFYNLNSYSCIIFVLKEKTTGSTLIGLKSSTNFIPEKSV